MNQLRLRFLMGVVMKKGFATIGCCGPELLALEILPLDALQGNILPQQRSKKEGN